MKRIACLFAVPIFACSLSAQQKDFILMEGSRDTIFCTVKTMLRTAGAVTEIEYVTRFGDEVRLERDSCRRVRSLRAGDHLWEYAPLSASKKYMRHQEVTLVGALRVYEDKGVQCETDKKGERSFFFEAAGNRQPVKVRFPDGSWADVNKKTLKEEIAPQLMKCPAFAKEAQEMNMENYFELFTLYNKVCPN